MAIDSTTLRSRRALLTAAFGAGLASIASALGRPRIALAADGQTMQVGGEYVSTSVTSIASANSGVVLRGRSSEGGIGVNGSSVTGRGVYGTSGENSGVHGHSSLWIGVYATSVNGVGVWADSDNYIGGVFQGGRAQLQLVPNSSTGKPARGSHSKGEIYMDSSGSLFVCVAGGTPGTWRKVTTTAA